MKIRYLKSTNERQSVCGVRPSSGAEASAITKRPGLFVSSEYQTSLRPRTGALLQRAFTLIELLLVLVILGILAAIVVPKFSGRTEQARQAAAQTQIANFSTALDAFEVDNGYYPKGKSGLNDLVSAPRDAQGWKGPYLKDIPNDPWAKPYIYQGPGKHNTTSYDLSSMGPDGRENTEDDVTNWQTKK